jgi:hypothetical protein
MQVVSHVSVRRRGLTGGSTECSPYPAADARSAAPVKRRGVQVSTTVPTPYRPALGRAFLHCGEGPEPSGPGPAADLEPKTPVQRSERDHPGDLIHIDVIKLSRFLWRYCYARPHSSLGSKTPYTNYTKIEPSCSRSELAILGGGIFQ